MKKQKIIVIASTFLLVLIILYFMNPIFVFFNRSRFTVGLDVSHHQSEISWDKINKRIQFVFIKATEGDDYVDSRFKENALHASEAGFLVGAYHFFHFNYDGSDQAQNFIRTVGKEIDLPPVIDFENLGNAKEYDAHIIINELREMIDVLHHYYGVYPIIYTTSDYRKILEDEGLFRNIWYRNVLYPAIPVPDEVVFWQYSNRAHITGIKGRVDLNVFFGNEGQFKDYQIHFE